MFYVVEPCEIVRQSNRIHASHIFPEIGLVGNLVGTLPKVPETGDLTLLFLNPLDVTEKGLFLLSVLFRKASRNTWCSLAASKSRPTTFVLVTRVEDSLHARFGKCPGSTIQRNNIRGVEVLIEIPRGICPGERMQLLNPCDGSVCDTMRLPIFL